MLLKRFEFVEGVNGYKFEMHYEHVFFFLYNYYVDSSKEPYANLSIASLQFTTESGQTSR